MTAHELWKSDRPIILASTSATRLKLLTSAGIPCRTVSPEVDERSVSIDLEKQGAGPDSIARELARAKCLAVSARFPDDIVLGADQTLAVDSHVLTKPASRAEAADHLRLLSGRTHVLYAGVVLARDRTVLFETVDQARLTMRVLSEPFIAAYLDAAGDRVQTSVGAYQVEGLGIHLFERIDGDHSTILGLPLLPLLSHLRASHMVAA
jgi:septum formation protein